MLHAPLIFYFLHFLLEKKCCKRKIIFLLTHLPIMEIMVILVALLPVSFLIGSTIAKYRSADKAVKVNTETPIDRSLINSENLHTTSPYGHESTIDKQKKTFFMVEPICVKRNPRDTKIEFGDQKNTKT